MKPTKNDIERRLEEAEDRSSDDEFLIRLKEAIVDKDGEVQDTEVTEYRL